MIRKVLLLCSCLLFISSSFSKLKKRTVIELNEKNSYTFRGQVMQATVDAAIVEITKLHLELPKGEPIYLTLLTPGGSIFAGNMLIEHLKSLGRPIHTITIFAASMGFVTVQSLGNRYITDNGMLMSHYGSTGCEGNYKQIKVCLKRLLAFEEKIEKVCADRMGMKVNDYNKLIEDDLWLLAEEAIKIKAADEIVDIKCSEELMKGKQVIKFETFFGEQTVEVSACPTMISPLEISKVKKNVK